VLRLGRFFGDVADAKQLGRWYVAPLDLRVSAYDVYQPDLCFFPTDGLPDPDVVPITSLPSIVIEVLSPGSRSVDMHEKLPQYAARGVPEYWILDPASSRFTLHVLGDDGAYVTIPVISGAIPVGVFAGTPIDLDAIFSA
jgi:Uma2 family endonuclease